MWHEAMRHGGYGPGFAVFAVAGVLVLLGAALLVAAVVVMARRGRGPQSWTAGANGPQGQAPKAPNGALMILDERLARGELDVNGYRALRAELSGVSASAGSGLSGSDPAA